MQERVKNSLIHLTHDASSMRNDRAGWHVRFASQESKSKIKEFIPNHQSFLGRTLRGGWEEKEAHHHEAERERARDIYRCVCDARAKKKNWLIVCVHGKAFSEKKNSASGLFKILDWKMDQIRLSQCAAAAVAAESWFE